MTKKRFLPLLVLVAVLLTWKLAVEIFHLSVQTLPPPERVFIRFTELLRSGVIQRDVVVTLEEIAVGFGMGLVAGVVAGFFLARHELASQILSPFILVFQTAPKISLAPLFVLWFGLGMASKVVLIALVTFFPIMLNMMVGIRSTSSDYIDLLTILRANSRQRLLKVELMNALPFLLTGMRIGLVLSVTAAIIGEMMGAKAGLGFLLITGNEMYDISLVLSAIIVISVLSYVLDLLMRLLESRLLFWHESSDAGGNPG